MAPASRGRALRLVLAAAAGTAAGAQSTVAVWTQLPQGCPVSPADQARFDMSKNTLSVGTTLSVVVNASCHVLYSDRPDRPWGMHRFGNPYFTCSRQIMDPHVAFYESGVFHPRWFLTGFTNTSGGDPACVNGTLQSYEIDGAACGTGDWLQHSFDPAFAGSGGGHGTGGGPPFTDYFTRFAARTGPVVLGGRNTTSGERTPEVWAVCRSFFDCPNLGWRRGDDVPQDCAGPGRTFAAFSVDNMVFVACGREGASPGPLSLYELRVPRLAWIKYGNVPDGLFAAPLAQVQFEQLRGPDDGPSSADVAAAADEGDSSSDIDDAPRVNPANSITAKGGCVVALVGGPGYPGPAQVSTSYGGLNWVTTAAPFPSRTRAGLSSWRPNRMAVLGGLAADGSTYLTDGWAADYTLCCATACDPTTGACTLCNGRGACSVDAHNLCLCDAGWTGDWCELNASTPTGSRTPSSSPSSQPYDPSRGGGGTNVSPGALGGLALGSAAGGAVLAVASMLLLRRRRALRWSRGGAGAGDAAFSTSASLPLADDGVGSGGSGPAGLLAGHPVMTVSRVNPVAMAAAGAPALDAPYAPSAPAYVAPEVVPVAQQQQQPQPSV